MLLLGQLKEIKELQTQLLALQLFQLQQDMKQQETSLENYRRQIDENKDVETVCSCLHVKCLVLTNSCGIGS